jgi:hypothetical protein
MVLKILSKAKEARLKKSKLIEQLEEAELIDKGLSIAAKHSKIKGLLNSIATICSTRATIKYCHCCRRINSVQ